MKEIKLLLDEAILKYNTPAFIESDPISIPHKFSQKENIEIAGFLTATIAWGQRVSILKNARRLMTLMWNDPYRFIMEADDSDKLPLLDFCHRTFQASDLLYFITALRLIYADEDGLEAVFSRFFDQTGSIEGSLIRFHELFFSLEHPQRTRKHLANVSAGASAKRLNMFLRWMIRNDNCGVDFGIWKEIPSSALYIPLDLHTGNVARKLGLLNRNQNDWKAVAELTSRLREFDVRDPIKYDFALFGLGVFEGWK